MGALARHECVHPFVEKFVEALDVGAVLAPSTAAVSPLRSRATRRRHIRELARQATYVSGWSVTKVVVDHVERNAVARARVLATRVE